MTPYFQDEHCTIYCGDCREVLPTLGPVDLVLTDPPYGTVDGRGKITKRGNSLEDFNPGDWDRELPLWWVELALERLSMGHWICAFTDKLSVKALWDEIERYSGNGKQTFYWIKTNPPPQPRKNFCSGIETAVCATKGPVIAWNGGGWTVNYKEFPLVPNHRRTPHPTQKPVELMAHLIRIFGGDGVILDPFMGSGTTLVAAKQLGRKSIGIEISEEYCKIAVERLRQEVFDFTEPLPEPAAETLSLFEQ